MLPNVAQKCFSCPIYLNPRVFRPIYIYWNRHTSKVTPCLRNPRIQASPYCILRSSLFTISNIKLYLLVPIQLLYLLVVTAVLRVTISASSRIQHAIHFINSHVFVLCSRYTRLVQVTKFQLGFWSHFPFFYNRVRLR